MSDATDTPKPSEPVNPFIVLLDRLGRPVNGILGYIGDLADMGMQVIGWLIRSLVLRQVRFGRAALYHQMVRIGVRSVGIIMLVSACIGLILVLQMAPPLADFDQTDKVANVNAVAVLRELGPLISAIVLTGFAGAAIAAELGTMVVGEEIEALEVMALHPVRFLVVPRVLATVFGLMVLTVLADVTAILAGAAMGVMVLDIPLGVYKANTLDQASLSDFITGVLKAGVFGALIGIIACNNGLKVTGGAAGVGRATTSTVVFSIVAIIGADLLFTSLFYVLGWT
jgi:phospholipid/cholesterol/gamma-HCH transport system permease protein